MIDETWELKTIRNGNAYSICNSLYCSNCEHLFLDIRFSEEELFNLYEGYRNDDYALLRDFYEPGYIIRNEELKKGIEYIYKIEEFLNPFFPNTTSTLLDWGGDTGLNTPFQTKNFKIDIYDLNEVQPIINARKISKEAAFLNKYSLVVCSNVLEHAPYPADLLFDIVKCMDENTILYIEVPIEDIVLSGGDNLHLHKKHWHEHINFFSENSISALVENSGLRLIKFNKLNVDLNGKSVNLFQLACRLSNQ